jgi:hypothetical protein
MTPLGFRPDDLSASVPMLRWLLVVSLVVAGLVHVAIAPEHLEESALIGAAMLAAGIAQLGLAALVQQSHSRVALAGAAVLNCGLIGAYVAAVTIGLPAEPHPHGAASMATGHGSGGHVEAVTPLGLTTTLIEAIATGVAGILVVASRAVGNSSRAWRDGEQRQGR